MVQETPDVPAWRKKQNKLKEAAGLTSLTALCFIHPSNGNAVGPPHSAGFA